MSGPRDLRRGRKPFERPADMKEIVGARSHYIITASAAGWTITVNRRGQLPATQHCATEGEMRRATRQLSDDGLIGVNESCR
ncbi:hypothetical protein [Aurantimonas marina]|uniref:hypothetical protein n=1 Tax=Aurantimonas marina TaxID=2780508 RepID=UPI0019D05FF8|nr:hypothetical protein [Aurantimonas marina]